MMRFRLSVCEYICNKMTKTEYVFICTCVYVYEQTG